MSYEVTPITPTATATSYHKQAAIQATTTVKAMPRYGSHLQRDASYLFGERDKIIEEMRKLSMYEFHKKVPYYREKIELLKTILEESDTYLDDMDLAQALIDDPGYENTAFDLDEYTYKDRTWIYESEIVEFSNILKERMELYEATFVDSAELRELTQLADALDLFS